MSATVGELERLYRARFSDFLRVATALTGNVESGREAVHDGFVNAVRSRKNFRGDGSLDGWVWKAVVNNALSRQRRNRVHNETLFDTAAEAALSPAASNPDARLDLRSAVSALPKRQRLVLFLRYYADLDYQAIADATGISAGTVGATLHAAHKALRTRLQEVPVP